MKRIYLYCLLVAFLLAPSAYASFLDDLNKIITTKIREGDIVRFVIPHKYSDESVFLSFNLKVNKNTRLIHILKEANARIKDSHIEIPSPYPNYIKEFAQENKITLSRKEIHVTDVKFIRSLDKNKHNIDLKKGSYLSFDISGPRFSMDSSDQRKVINSRQQIIKRIDKDQKLLDFLQVEGLPFTSDGLVITRPSLVKNKSIFGLTSYVYYNEKLPTISNFRIVDKAVSKISPLNSPDYCERLINAKRYKIYKMYKSGNSGYGEEVIKLGKSNKIIKEISSDKNISRYFDIFTNIDDKQGHRTYPLRYIEKIKFNDKRKVFKGVFQDVYSPKYRDKKDEPVYNDFWGAWTLSIIDKSDFYINGCLLDVFVIEIEENFFDWNRELRESKKRHWYSPDLNLVIKSDEYELLNLEVVEGSDE